MSITTIIAEIPIGAIVVLGLALAALALRFRGIVSLTIGAICLLGTWNAGEAQPGLAIAVAFGFYVILSAVAGIFGSRTTISDDDGNAGYSYADEQARLASEYHRRQREGRF